MLAEYPNVRLLRLLTPAQCCEIRRPWKTCGDLSENGGIRIQQLRSYAEMCPDHCLHGPSLSSNPCPGTSFLFQSAPATLLWLVYPQECWTHSCLRASVLDNILSSSTLGADTHFYHLGKVLPRCPVSSHCLSWVFVFALSAQGCLTHRACVCGTCVLVPRECWPLVHLIPCLLNTYKTEAPLQALTVTKQQRFTASMAMCLA